MKSVCVVAVYTI